MHRLYEPRRQTLGRSNPAFARIEEGRDKGIKLKAEKGLNFPDVALGLSLLLSGATMSQQSSLTQSAHSVRQVLTAYNGHHKMVGLLPGTSMAIGRLGFNEQIFGVNEQIRGQGQSD